MATEIQIQYLFKKYPNGTQALKGVSLEIGKGQFFTLLGPNGAGKSTLVKIVTTLIQKDSGSFAIAELNPEKDFSAIRNIIGVASQNNEIDPNESTENLLIFQGRLFGLSKTEAVLRSDELIRLFQLDNERKKKQALFRAVINADYIVLCRWLINHAYFFLTNLPSVWTLWQELTFGTLLQKSTPRRTLPFFLLLNILTKPINMPPKWLLLLRVRFIMRGLSQDLKIRLILTKVCHWKIATYNI